MSPTPNNQFRCGDSASESRLLGLLKRTGYTMLQENGQRKYGGPPPKWEGPPPVRGCEVFVGKIPRDCMEDELVPIFEKIGKIYEMRLMMDFSGFNRGFGFVTFTNKDDAQRACEQLNNYQIRKNCHVGVVMSVDNCRLYFGGIPKQKGRDEVKAEVAKITDGVVDVILYPTAQDKSKNRGFAFVEYETHRAAAMARRKLVPGRLSLWNHPIRVDWAEPEQDVDEETMSRVRILYVRNLSLSTTEQRLREFFETLNPGCVERVKKQKDYAFIHFISREYAELALYRYNGSQLDGAVIEVLWSKPADKTINRYLKNFVKMTEKNEMNNVNSAAVYGSPFAAQLYSSSINTNFAMPTVAALPAHPMITPPMLTASPIITPSSDSNFAQPALNQLVGRPLSTTGASRAGNRGAAGMRSAGFKQAVANTMRNVINAKFQNSPKMLEEYCIQNGLGLPQYQLETKLAKDTLGNEVYLYLYKVTIPMLANFGPSQSNQFSASIEEAKDLAAYAAMISANYHLQCHLSAMNA